MEQLTRFVAMRRRTLITLVLLMLGSATALGFISLRNSQAHDATQVDGQRVAHAERVSGAVP